MIGTGSTKRADSAPIWVQSLIAAVAATAVATTGSALTRPGPWYANLKKPFFQLPDWFSALPGQRFLFAARSLVCGLGDVLNPRVNGC